MDTETKVINFVNKFVIKEIYCYKQYFALNLNQLLNLIPVRW